MIQGIIKRDGRVVEFNNDKIAQAIYKAFKASGSANNMETAQRLSMQVESEIIKNKGEDMPTVEEVQDIVERVLIENGFVRTAKSYILYRAERSRIREMNTRLMRIYDEITFTEARDSDIKRENANINGDTAMGAMLKYGSEGAKQFYTMFILKPEHSNAHNQGDIHIHDLDFLTLTTTCCQIDIIELFNGGFSTGHGVLREPNDIASYAALACIAIQANQNDQHGGQSLVNFDYGMALGVRKTFVRLYRQNLARALDLICGKENMEDEIRSMMDEIKQRTGLVPALGGSDEYQAEEQPLLAEIAGEYTQQVQDFAQRSTEKEIDRATYQAMEAFIHNLNTMHSRAGAQTPFSSINYGMDTSPEGRLAMKNLLLATEAGLGNGETPIFPIQIFRVKEGVSYNKEDPNYDLFRLACRVSSKRLFPNFSFVDAPFNIQYYKPGHPETEVAYMGCRTRVLGNVYDENNQISPRRGNLSFTSINLPRLALQANRDISLFFDSLDRVIDLVIDQLMERFEIQARKHVYNFPFLMGEGVWLGSENLSWDDEIREVLMHGTLSIGFIGLAETLTALIGEHHGQSEHAQNLGLEIIGHMRNRMDEESKKRNMNFTLLATPGEGLSGRFVKLDAEKFGKIPGVTDREYYTNSFHIPVHFPISVYDKINLEAPYHALTNAGHITYVELDGDPSDNLEAFEKIVRIMHDAGVGYGSINHPVDRDPECGFNGIINDACPSCGRAEGSHPFVRIRRITGYLVGTLSNFNNAKRAEERSRLKHVNVVQR